MNEPSDFELLRDYARNGDAGLFREVMGRHLPMAYAAALRASGDPAIAAEAAQDAFIKLHQVPGMFLKSGTPLVAWVHRVSRHRAIDLVRSEKARARREQIAAALLAPRHDAPSPAFPEILDELIDALPARDRDLILQRYYSGRALSAIGRQAKLSEDAVRMRLKRALERLQGSLQARGIHTTAAFLATALPGHAACVPPPGLDLQIMSAIGISGTSKLSLPWLLHLMTSTQKIGAAVALAIAGIAIVKLPIGSDTPGGREGVPVTSQSSGSPPFAASPGGKAVRSSRPAADLTAAQSSLSEKYGSTLTKLAFDAARSSAELARMDLESAEEEKWQGQERESMKFLLEQRFGESLGLSEDQKKALFEQFIPEWQGIRLEQQGRAAALAQENQAASAETLLALDAWNRDEISAEECQEITARTTALLREGDADAIAALNCYEQDPTPAPLFGGDAVLREAFERHLDPGQREEFRKMAGEVARPEVLKKVSVEDTSKAMSKRVKMTRLRNEE
jgi:RNA polymerase sigma factor (sigma-70 family)